ncbi:MAG: M14 family zinc carboxypeptidase [Planctomycetia bacterium]|nr:M14 family zinc carboxypeptidase [Planctomycetia bacterium]
MKNVINVFLISLLVLTARPLTADENVTWSIDADFPGGNMILDSQTEDSVSFHSDRRDSGANECTDRHWAVRVRNAQGKTIHFKINGDSKFGYLQERGPSVSRDGGATWQWLLDADAPVNPADTFDYTFGPNEDDVRFAVVPMYTGQTIRLLVEEMQKKGCNIRCEVLCQSEKGREVELLRFGNPDNEKKVGVVFTSRSHCNETWGVWTLNGIIRECLSGSPEGNYLLDNADFFVVPLMDKDGVEDGDQGKCRIPHDHNRDFEIERYASVRALKKQVTEWGKGKRLIGCDFHGNSVGLRSNVVKGAEWACHPHFFIINDCNKEEEEKFSKMLFERQKGGFAGHPMKDAYNLIGPSWVVGWMATAPDLDFVICPVSESPSQSPDGKAQTIETAHELGANFAKALADYIKTM